MDQEPTVVEVRKGWHGDDGAKYREVVVEEDGRRRRAVQKGVDGRYVLLERDG